MLMEESQALQGELGVATTKVVLCQCNLFMQTITRGGRDIESFIFLCQYFPPTLDGYSYERSAITEWFSKGRRTSPVTNLPLTNTLLLPNRALRMVIEQQKWLKKFCTTNADFCAFLCVYVCVFI